jgi:hypothetical protein
MPDIEAAASSLADYLRNYRGVVSVVPKGGIIAVMVDPGAEGYTISPDIKQWEGWTVKVVSQIPMGGDPDAH